MKVNGIDIRKYNAKQLTVDIQPAEMQARYEWITKALMPTEFESEVGMGKLKLAVYFRGKDRNRILRTASEFVENFKDPCDIELDGFKGKYRGYMTSNDFEKMKSKERMIVNMEFEGYIYDDEVILEYDGLTDIAFWKVGTRDTPCTLEIEAKETLENYRIYGFSNETITIERLERGKTVVIDGFKGTAKIDGVNAFEIVDLWEFPKIKAGETKLQTNSENAKIKITYKPMWL